MRLLSKGATERGMALVTALLALMLITGLMAGAFAAINADVRSNAIDRDQTQAYAAAHAGLEKLTSDLASLFIADVSPSIAQINALAANEPDLTGFEFRAPGGAAGSGYAVTWTPDANGNPAALANADITAGPYQGFKGLITPYNITVTARSVGGAEVRLRRELQTVAVPVFQFGVFSQGDLTFYAGDDFGFGGRVHTNANLFLSENTGQIMTFADRITSVGEVVRSYFPNGAAITGAGLTFSGTVRIVKVFGSPNTYRNLLTSEASLKPAGELQLVNGNPVSAGNKNPNWTSISMGTTNYKGNVRTTLTGAKRLDLPLVSQGAAPVDLIRRPVVLSNENVANPPVFGQRFFSQASLRILLSDRTADITDLPTVTAAAPLALDGDWEGAPPAGYGPVDATHPPIARSIGPVPTMNRRATTHPATASSFAGGLATIMVCTGGGPDCTGDVPAMFGMPPAGLTVGPNLNVQCTGKTASSFTGCTGIVTPLALGGQVVSAVFPWGTVQTLTTGPLVGGAATIPVTANSTGPFSHNQFFLTTPAGVTSNVSCTGFDNDPATVPRRFLGCSGLTAAPPVNSTISTYAHTDLDTSLAGGFIKIEKQNSAGVWTDVTMEILNLGIGAPNQEGTICADPTPNAVIRVQRLRDNAGGALGCHYPGSLNSYDWWPNALYDTREGDYRDTAITAGAKMGGVMHYISLDVNNLRRWLAGTIGTTGNVAWNNNGYIVYFSDRRGDHNENLAGDPETGEFGFEDNINPASGTGAQNTTLDVGEDANGNGILDRWGETPHPLAIPAGTVVDPYSANGLPWSPVNLGEARVNRPVLFRRALKLINGGIVGGVNSLPATGLTVAAENPVYVQGNYNATTDPNAEPNVPAAILADAVMVLSSNWSDAVSFRFPTDRNSRDAVTTGYRFAVISGKSLNFPRPAGTQTLFGTDGGVGNFLRLLENWLIAGVSINYRGSVVSLFNSRQATGTFRWGTNVYSFGTRNFTFDTDFLTPALLPPGTPMFRDVNTLNFRQILRPNQ